MINRKNKGFVLPMTLWIVAILSLASTYFYTWVDDTLNRTKILRFSAQGYIDLYNAKSDLLFWLFTQEKSKAGIEFKNLSQKGLDQLKESLANGQEFFTLKMVDTPYLAHQKVSVSLQDLEGLINLNSVPEPLLLSLLKGLGVDEQKAQSLNDKFLDYSDPSNVGSRLQGASDDDYIEAGLPKPPHIPLRTLFELKRVLEWPNEKALWTEYALPALLTTNGSGKINLNTAPKKVLEAIPETPKEFVSTLLKRRSEEISFFKDKKEFEAELGSSLGSNVKLFSFDGKGKFRITLKHQTEPLFHQLEISLEQDSYGRPWKVHYDVAFDGHLTPGPKTRNKKEETTDESDQPAESPALPDPEVLLSGQ